MITGASSGVGAATARALARPGRALWLLARRPTELDAVAQQVRAAGGEARGLPCDVSDPAAVRDAFARIGSRIDLLVNAAALPAGTVADADPEHIARVVSVNLLGTMFCAREAATRMRDAGRGTILNVGSLCLRVRDGGASLYVAAKLGVGGFTDSLRKELAPHGVRVILVNPGQIASGMVTETPEQRDEAIRLERMLTPDEVADAIRYCVELPDRVVIAELEIRPRAQSGL
ncbi:MAG: SDR family NAD(P)-dependent oxidoreductase [Gluconacetobacter diazotrophicus]|nr:SDR family NAD(P)-dependent oxidoreductase [Gluconacetobacter diazotrophicus]